MFTPNKIENPKIVSLPIGKNNSRLNCFEFRLSEEERKICEETAERYSTNERDGGWGLGILNVRDKEKLKTEKIGLFGEMALAKLLGLEFNDERVEGGVKQDFFLEEKSLEMKTSEQVSIDLVGLIRAENERGRHIPLESDLYFFGFTDRYDQYKKTPKVTLIGHVVNENICRDPKEPKVRGDWKNYEVPYADMTSIVDFYKERE